jgi:hypothetical protein
MLIMRVPATNWPEVALDDDVITNLEYYTNQHTDTLRNLAAGLSDCLDGETPEMLATHIGSILHNRSSNDTLCTPIEDDIEGKPGRQLAYGFVGAKAIAAATDADPNSEKPVKRD